MKQKRNKYGKLVYFLPFLFLILLFEFVPFFRMLKLSITGSDGGLGLDNFAQILQKPIYRTAIKNSVGISIYATIAGILVDFLLGLALSSTKNKEKAWYLSLLNLTSTFAGLPLTLAFITILGTSGVFVLIGQNIGFTWLSNYNLYSMNGMLLVYLYFQIPMGTLLLVPSFQKVRKEWRESATLMNCSAIRFWLKIGIPVMMPSIMGTSGMLFASALTAYTTPYLLVNNSIALLPIKIADMFVGDVRQRPELGSALSVVLLAIMLTALLVTNLIKRYFERGQK